MLENGQVTRTRTAVRIIMSLSSPVLPDGDDHR